MDSELRCGSATQLEFLGYDSVTKTAEALVPRAATRGALSKSEISGCAVGSPAACAVVSLGASLVNLEPAPDEVSAEGTYSQGMRRCHELMLPRDSGRAAGERYSCHSPKYCSAQLVILVAVV